MKEHVCALAVPKYNVGSETPSRLGTVPHKNAAKESLAQYYKNTSHGMPVANKSWQYSYDRYLVGG